MTASQRPRTERPSLDELRVKREALKGKGAPNANGDPGLDGENVIAHVRAVLGGELKVKEAYQIRGILRRAQPDIFARLQTKNVNWALRKLGAVVSASGIIEIPQQSDGTPDNPTEADGSQCNEMQ